MQQSKVSRNQLEVETSEKTVKNTRYILELIELLVWEFALRVWEWTCKTLLICFVRIGATLITGNHDHQVRVYVTNY